MDFKGININVAVLSKYKDENLLQWMKDNKLDAKDKQALKKALADAKKQKTN